MARETEVKVDKLEVKFTALAEQVIVLQEQLDKVLSILSGEEGADQPVQNGKVRKAHR